MLADPDLGVSSNQAAHPHHIDPFVFRIGGHGDRRGHPLSFNLNHISPLKTERTELSLADTDDSFADILLRSTGDL